MARAKNTAAQEAATSDEASGPTVIKVQGILFPVTPRYAAGHVMTHEEALTLNQTLFENLRNNFASHVKSATEAAEAAAKETGEEFLGLPAETLNELQAKFAEYAASYVFRAPRPGRAPADPIEREMAKIAKERVTALLQSKKIAVKSLPEGKMAEYIETVLAKRGDEIRAEAVERVAKRKAVSEDLIDLG